MPASKLTTSQNAPRSHVQTRVSEAGRWCLLMLELTAALLVRRLVHGESAPQPLLGNSELGESLEILVGGHGSSAAHMPAKRIDDAELDCSPCTCRRSEIRAFSLFPGTGLLDR